MKVQTFNEEFITVWNKSNAENHKDKGLREKVGVLIQKVRTGEDNGLVYIGDAVGGSPYGLIFSYIPVSCDGEKEYIIIHNERLLVYRESNMSNRIIVWPGIAMGWLVNGTESQIEFVRKYSMNIVGFELDENNEPIENDNDDY